MELTYKNTRNLPLDEKLNQIENFCNTDHPEIISIPNKTLPVVSNKKNSILSNNQQNQNNLNMSIDINPEDENIPKLILTNTINENDIQKPSNDCNFGKKSNSRNSIKSIYSSDGSHESNSCEKLENIEAMKKNLSENKGNFKTQPLQLSNIGMNQLNKVNVNQNQFQRNKDGSSEMNYCNYSNFDRSSFLSKRNRNESSSYLLFQGNNLNKKQSTSNNIIESTLSTNVNKSLEQQVDKALQNISKY